MIHLADDQLAGPGLDLRMALQTKIIIPLHQHLGIDGPMRAVADRAPFAQGFVLESKRPRLFPMALRTRFIQPGHGQAAGRLLDVAAMGIVAFHTIHTILHDGMVVREVDFGVNLQMALKTARWVFAGIDDEFAAPAARGDVLASSSVARFAPGHAGPFWIVLVKPAVRADREDTRNIRVAIETSLVPDERSAFDFGRSDDRTIHGCARAEQHAGQRQHPQEKTAKESPPFHGLNSLSQPNRRDWTQTSLIPAQKTRDPMNKTPKLNSMSREPAHFPLFFKPY